MSNFSISCLYPFSRMKVENFYQEIDSNNNNVLYTTVSPDLRYAPVCHECGSKAIGVHANKERTIRDLNLGLNKSYLNYKYRKIECPHCNSIKVEELDVISLKGPRVTNRMKKYIYDLCKIMTITDVAEHLDIDWKTVKRIDKEFLEEEYGETDYSHSGYLAVDEIAVEKHHKYMTVVIDFITGRVIWAGKDHTIETLDEFFGNMPEEHLKNIKAVAMDMWKPFINSVKKWCPNASIVFDKFHIVAHFNKIIDEVRRNEQRDKNKTEEEQKVIKGSRWILLKNRDNLKETETPKLEKLLEVNENLSKVYILKDELKLIWNAGSQIEIEKAVDDWCELALQTELKPVIKFVKMLQNHKYGIVSYANHNIHTSKLEGTNNKIKEIKRSAYGFRDYNYFKLKIKQAFPGN